MKSSGVWKSETGVLTNFVYFKQEYKPLYHIFKSTIYNTIILVRSVKKFLGRNFSLSRLYVSF